MHAMFFSVKRVHLRVLAISRGLLREIVLTPARFDMMRIIGLHHEHGILEVKLRELLGVSAATVSVMLRSLELLGFVRRSRFVRDARHVLVSITEVGSHQLELATSRLIDPGVADRVAERAFSNEPDAGARDVVTARGFLRTIRGNYSDPAPFEHPWTMKNIYDIAADAFLPELYAREPELLEDIQMCDDE